MPEDLIYVDCQLGLDVPECGTPESPCRTLAHAWTVIADGGGDGAEDILCFAGVCSPEALSPAVGGAAGVVTLPRVGHQARDFELPENPTMLVGWDRDADGVYPPLDPDDIAVLDGGGGRTADSGLSRPFVFSSRNSRLEMAHFSVRDYGRYSEVQESGFVRFTERGGLRGDHFYFHDLSLHGINQDQPAQSHRIVFNLFTGGTSFHHLAFVNLEILNAAGFMVRGAGPYLPPSAAVGGDDGPYRWQRLSVTAHGCDDSDDSCRAGGGSAFIGWKLWGYLDGIEILDSVFEANLADWRPKTGGNGGAVLVSATQCSRGWTVRNNAVYDFKVGFRARGGFTTYCGYDDREPPRQVPRPTDNVRFERNLFLNRFGGWHHGDWFVHLEGGEDARRSLGDVRVRDNVLISTAGFDACLRLDVGHSGTRDVGDPPGQHPGRIEISGNICHVLDRQEGARRSVGLEIGRRHNLPYLQHRILVQDNVFSGFDRGDLNLRLSYLPEEIVLDGNTWSPGAGLIVERQTLASFEDLAALIGDPERADSPARICRPIFADPIFDAESLELRLDDTDTCLRPADDQAAPASGQEPVENATNSAETGAD